MRFISAHRQLSNDPIAAGQGAAADDLLQIADEFRAWVTRDLQRLPAFERDSFRGDYLFTIDGTPLFLVVVSGASVSSARWEESALSANPPSPLHCDLGDPLALEPDAVQVILSGQVRVGVQTDSNTLRRLLRGTLRAKVAYLNGLVKISGDLPCFMRLVAVLKGRGVGPVRPVVSDA